VASKNREKDQAMAARLKKDGVKRDSARCPICNKVMNLKDFANHIGHHPA
jgi:uncharacterized protein with PIN domain